MVQPGGVPNADPSYLDVAFASLVPELYWEPELSLPEPGPVQLPGLVRHALAISANLASICDQPVRRAGFVCRSLLLVSWPLLQPLEQLLRLAPLFWAQQLQLLRQEQLVLQQELQLLVLILAVLPERQEPVLQTDLDC